MRRMVWFFVLAVCVVACEKRDTLQAPVETSQKQGKLPDDDPKTGTLVTRFHRSTSRYARETVSRVAARGELRGRIEGFAAAGYELAAEHSFVVSATRTSDGREIEVTILSLANTRAPERDAIYIFHVRDGTRELFAPVRLSFEDGELAYAKLADGVWLGAVRPEQFGRGTVDPTTGYFSWGRYFECVGVAVASAALACGITCRFLPMAYIQCTTICFGQSVITAMVNCVLYQMA